MTARKMTPIQIYIPIQNTSTMGKACEYKNIVEKSFTLVETASFEVSRYEEMNLGLKMLPLIYYTVLIPQRQRQYYDDDGEEYQINV